jgi:diguanylate cyclase (GGDEF)-like protein
VLPKGGYLPELIWQRRHTGILIFLWLHVGAFVVVAATSAHGGDAIRGASFVAIAAAFAGMPRLGKRGRACAATLGLVTCSALVIHLAHGLTEARFHFFIVLGIITLYQDWIPFLLAVTFVFLHEGIAGSLDPTTVYNHPDAWAHPWRWAAIHAAIVVAASAVNIVTWHLNEFRALHDPLTELSNRLGFLGAVERGFVGMARQRQAPRLLLFDLDDFKAVNDRFGHQAGDELLVAVAARLRGAVRREDTVARLGGDEFGILLYGVSEDDTARIVAKRLIGVMAAPFAVCGVTLHISASVGLATGETIDGPTGLLRRADVALYDAKRHGKGQYAVFTTGMERIPAPA